MPSPPPNGDRDDRLAAHTAISTARGAVPLASLHPGDRVCTLLGGDTARVVWTGRRTVDCARHPAPHKVWPIRVAANAFGRGMPANDLVLSPGHAVYFGGSLIPAGLLANGRSVRRVRTERIASFHIELTRHDVILANGLPVASFFPAGDRTLFGNGGTAIALHPDFESRPWGSACAPVTRDGADLDAAIRRLEAVSTRRRRRHPHAAG